MFCICCCVLQEFAEEYRQEQLPTCAGCGKHYERTALKRCSKCLGVAYCSRECQVAHWKGGHKQHCQEIAAAMEAIKAGQPVVEAASAAAAAATAAGAPGTEVLHVDPGWATRSTS